MDISFEDADPAGASYVEGALHLLPLSRGHCRQVPVGRANGSGMNVESEFPQQSNFAEHEDVIYGGILTQEVREPECGGLSFHDPSLTSSRGLILFLRNRCLFLERFVIVGNGLGEGE